MKRCFAAAICAAILATGCGQALLTLEVPAEEIQKKLDEKFPMSPMGEGGGMPFTLRLSDPKVGFDEAEGRVTVALALEVQLPQGGPAPPKPSRPNLPKPRGGPPGFPPGPPGPLGSGDAPAFPEPATEDAPASEAPALPEPPKSISGRMTISAKPEFDAATKSLFLREPRVVQLALDGLPEPINQPLQALAQEKLAEKLQDSPVPTPSGGAAEIGKALVKQIVVGSGGVKIELGL